MIWWCRQKNKPCSTANENGYCQITACCNTSKPTVNAESVRHGHWVKNDNGTYSCSECHSWIPNEQHYYARYCLFCGAKMNEEKENEKS